jgi:hypothetical protein
MFDCCPECNEKQWSIMDKNYLKIYGKCWYCDKELWERGFLSLEEFENREKKALEEK